MSASFCTNILCVNGATARLAAYATGELRVVDRVDMRYPPLPFAEIEVEYIDPTIQMTSPSLVISGAIRRTWVRADAALPYNDEARALIRACDAACRLTAEARNQERAGGA